MKTMHLVLCAVTLFANDQLRAQLGETIEECTARYGEPKRIDADQSHVTFKKDGTSFRCRFREGKCECVIISRLTEKGPLAEFSDAEIDAFLESNGGGWTPQPEFSYSSSKVNLKYWRDDAGGTATSTGKMLIIRRGPIVPINPVDVPIKPVEGNVKARGV